MKKLVCALMCAVGFIVAPCSVEASPARWEFTGVIQQHYQEAGSVFSGFIELDPASFDTFGGPGDLYPRFTGSRVYGEWDPGPSGAFVIAGSSSFSIGDVSAAITSSTARINVVKGITSASLSPDVEDSYGVEISNRFADGSSLSIQIGTFSFGLTPGRTGVFSADPADLSLMQPVSWFNGQRPLGLAGSASAYVEWDRATSYSAGGRLTSVSFTYDGVTTMQVAPPPPIPEPGTEALFAAGFVGLFASRKFRRASKA